MTGELNPPTGPAAEPSAGGSQPGLAAEEVSLGLVLQGLLESLSEGLIVFDGEYRYRFWNPFMEKLTGLGADQVLGRRPADLFPHIAEQGVDSMLRRAMAGETVESHDLPYRVPATGRDGWVVGRYFPFRNREGRIVGVVALVRDITERKRAQDALAASRRELALHNAIAEIFLTTPDDQMYEKVLRQVLSYLESPIGIFGFIDDSGDLHLPFTVHDAMDAATVDRGPVICPNDSWSGAWGAALHERRSVLANRPGALPPGHIPITRSICAPIVDRDKIIGLLAVASRDDDYTADQLRELEGIAGHVGPILHARLARDRLEGERDAFNRALQASETWYRAIVQQQTEFVARYLPDATLTFVNEALCRYAGKPRAELLGQSLWQILSEDQRHRTIAHLETLTPDQPTGENEISWAAPDGTIRWVSFVNHALFDSQGRVVEYQSVGRDVTDRHERELELERAVAEKEILLKEIHHRVKNNMAVISSLLSLHEREIEDPATREVFKAMRSRIKTMSLVHEQLYRSGDFEHVDLGSYVDQVASSIFQSQDDASGRISVHRDISSVTLGLDSAIPCGLILTELVSNALKHAFPEGRTGNVRVSLHERAPGEVELVVEDDGVGLDLADQSGFGLHMVELLVQQLGGTIERGVGAGRRVVVRFPVSSD
jgi:PAS domain S-box-containing protein